jgi:hypothetical protein
MVSRSIGHDTIFRRTNAPDYSLKTPIIWPSPFNTVGKKTLFSSLISLTGYNLTGIPWSQTLPWAHGHWAFSQFVVQWESFLYLGVQIAGDPSHVEYPTYKHFPIVDLLDSYTYVLPAGKCAIQDSNLLSAAPLIHALWLHDSLYLGR